MSGAEGLRFSGVIPANILPLDEELQIDERAYRAHLESLVAIEGVTAVTSNGHAAEVASLSRAERRRALAIAVETVAGRVPVISGVFAENCRDAAMAARDAEAEGADGLLVFPPSILAYQAPEGTAYRQFAAIAEAVDLPLVVFEYPAWSGLQHDVDTLLRICEVPTVAAVKEWSLDIRVHERNLAAIRSVGRPIAMLTSFSTNLLPALVAGADGILSGHGSVIAALQVELFDAVRQHRLADAQALYERIQRLTAVVYRAPMSNMYARMKEQLVMLGHDLHPAVRPPMVAVGEDERRDLEQALVDAGLIPVGQR
jgi:4-hydroxy-tetrahydrodipicolinate synthase